MDSKIDIESLIASSKNGFSSEALQGIVSSTEADPDYLLNFAKSLRNQPRTRHIAIWLLVEIAIAMSVKNRSLPANKRTLLPSVLPTHVPDIIITAKDVVDAIAYYLYRDKSKAKMPLSLKRGLAKSFSQFTAEELLKCRNYENKGTSIGDAINILHPEASTHEMRVIFRYLRGWDFDWEETQEVLKKVQFKE